MLIAGRRMVNIKSIVKPTTVDGIVPTVVARFGSSSMTCERSMSLTHVIDPERFSEDDLTLAEARLRAFFNCSKASIGRTSGNVTLTR